MKARWLVMTLLLHSGVPALAQLDNDPENAPPVHNETPQVPAHPVPPSQINADQAAVSPVGGGSAKPAPRRRPRRASGFRHSRRSLRCRSGFFAKS
jgi:hypothetical protein